MTTIVLTIEAYLRLVAHDIFVSRHDFAALHEHVKTFPVRRVTPKTNPVERICSALDKACCLYPKRALCLQRSAVLIKMLRSRGLHAHMIIGAQKLPFRAHAWVELDGRILNDRLASRENFLVLEVC
jgi:Transglutaminase-like superfamily